MYVVERKVKGMTVKQKKNVTPTIMKKDENTIWKCLEKGTMEGSCDVHLYSCNFFYKKIEIQG